METAFVVTGPLALIIIRVVAGIFVLGVVYFVRLSARATRRVVDSHRDENA